MFFNRTRFLFQLVSRPIHECSGDVIHDGSCGSSSRWPDDSTCVFRETRGATAPARRPLNPRQYLLISLFIKIYLNFEFIKNPNNNYNNSNQTVSKIQDMRKKSHKNQLEKSYRTKKIERVGDERKTRRHARGGIKRIFKKYIYNDDKK